jgi:tetratricopeptide (TPR) repeat protein
MGNEERNHLLVLRQTHLRRLRVLEIQAALAGNDVRPEIVIEIEDVQIQIAELDRQLGPQMEFASSPISRTFQVPHRRNPNFTGREELLISLRAALTSDQLADHTQAIYGLGGIGKTQLAVEYAYRHKADYSLVWWVRAEEPTTLATDYARLAQPLNLPERTASEQALVIKAVRAWLEQQGTWLLIFDDAVEPAVVEPYLPYSSRGHILITSRYPDWGEIAASLRVTVLLKEEAVAFLLKRTRLNNRRAAEQIVNLVDALPLALAQAGSYIAETACSLSDYVKLFHTHQVEMLTHGRLAHYPATATTTWDLAFRAVRQQMPAAADLLTLCAFLAPDAIYVDLFRRTSIQLPEPLATVIADELALNQAVATLRRYSLVERADDTLTVHRLVQAISREQLEHEQRQVWVELAVQLIDNAFPYDTSDVRNWSVCGRLLPHALAASEHAAHLQVALATTSRLLNQVGVYLHSRTSFGAAKTVKERALAIGEATLGPDHPDVATRLNNLALLLQDLGDLEGAKAHLERALAIGEASLGPDHPDLAMRLNNLGTVLQDLGDLEGAKAHLERALAIDEASLGQNHPNVGRDLNNLGTVLQDLGDLEGAKAHLERALAIGEASLGQNHPSIRTRLENLGKLLRAFKDFEGAKALYERALALSEATLGHKHPTTASYRENLNQVEEQLKMRSDR